MSTVITLNTFHVCAEVSDAYGKISYYSDSRRGSQARECEISTDPDPQNLFKGFVNNFLYMCIKIIEVVNF